MLYVCLHALNSGAHRPHGTSSPGLSSDTASVLETQLFHGNHNPWSQLLVGAVWDPCYRATGRSSCEAPTRNVRFMLGDDVG